MFNIRVTPVITIPLIGVISALVLILINCCIIVPQAYEYIIETFGKYTKSLKPGFNLVIPGIQKIRSKVSLKETMLHIAEQQIISKDNASVHVDALSFYQVQDSYKAVYVVSNFTDSLSSLVQTNIRTVMGSLLLDEILSQRETINARLLEILDEITQPWGIKVLRVEVKEIHPNKDILIALSRQITAERERRATIIEAEGVREAKYRAADAIERLADAEANAIRSVQAAISSTDKQAANYMIAQKYIESLTQLSKSNNTKVIMLPVDASSLLGSVAGISELFKAQNSPDPAPTKESV